MFSHSGLTSQTTMEVPNPQPRPWGGHRLSQRALSDLQICRQCGLQHPPGNAQHKKGMCTHLIRDHTAPGDTGNPRLLGSGGTGEWQPPQPSLCGKRCFLLSRWGWAWWEEGGEFPGCCGPCWQTTPLLLVVHRIEEKSSQTKWQGL